MDNMNLGQPILQRRLDECPANTYICRQADSNNGGTCCPLNAVCCQDGGCCAQGQICGIVLASGVSVPGCLPASTLTTDSTSSKTTGTTSSLSSTTWETTTTSTAPINTASVPQSNIEGNITNPAWIAGPIVGSIVGLLLILFCCVSCHRKNQSQLRKMTHEEDEVAPARTREEQVRFEKPELEDHRIPRRYGSIHEAPSKDALPHELYGDDVFKPELS
ncbi:hypothetical protein QBC37DRAFT_174306 [Rhypophila decipiens]|uniref:Uncharacterized protein n=1 Tax=Rhypophila decipiens TaxID=261697 RepID=A0AAN6Y6X8_9PEZI|nr:hypothetical protein QBC37DRAFT_174306 [Rhypophila decipiens]